MMERTTLHLPRSQPEAQGIPSAAVIAFLNTVKEKSWNCIVLCCLDMDR